MFMLITKRRHYKLWVRRAIFVLFNNDFNIEIL
jgi:hypothetical protein